MIGCWWLLAPLHFDDGWVRARETNLSGVGGFSNYYENWGANLPLGGWLEWLQHFVVAHTTSLAIHRLPAVALLAGTWLVCRHCLVRLLDASPNTRSYGWWSGTLVFCVGVTAFGMTLRPEPVLALLAVSVLACCLRYAREPGLSVLILAVLLVGLAATAHPAGVVAAAPLLVCFHRYGVMPGAVTCSPPWRSQ